MAQGSLPSQRDMEVDLRRQLNDVFGEFDDFAGLVGGQKQLFGVIPTSGVLRGLTPYSVNRLPSNALPSASVCLQEMRNIAPLLPPLQVNGNEIENSGCASEASSSYSHVNDDENYNGGKKRKRDRNVEDIDGSTKRKEKREDNKMMRDLFDDDDNEDEIKDRRDRDTNMPRQGIRMMIMNMQVEPLIPPMDVDTVVKKDEDEEREERERRKEMEREEVDRRRYDKNEEDEIKYKNMEEEDIRRKKNEEEDKERREESEKMRRKDDEERIRKREDEEREKEKKRKKREARQREEEEGRIQKEKKRIEKEERRRKEDEERILKEGVKKKKEEDAKKRLEEDLKREKENEEEDKLAREAEEEKKKEAERLRYEEEERKKETERIEKEEEIRKREFEEKKKREDCERKKKVEEDKIRREMRKEEEKEKEKRRQKEEEKDKRKKDDRERGGKDKGSLLLTIISHSKLEVLKDRKKRESESRDEKSASYSLWNDRKKKDADRITKKEESWARSSPVSSKNSSRVATPIPSLCTPSTSCLPHGGPSSPSSDTPLLSFPHSVSSCLAARFVPLSPPPLEQRVDGEGYTNYAKEKKHRGDASSDRVLRFLHYMESSLYFALSVSSCHPSRSSDRELSMAGCVLKDTVDLIKHALVLIEKEGNIHLMSRAKILCIRSQSVLNYHMYFVRSNKFPRRGETMASLESQVQEVPREWPKKEESGDMADKNTPSVPSTNHSSNMVTMPMSLWKLKSSQVSTYSHLEWSHMLWNDSIKLVTLNEKHYLNIIDNVIMQSFDWGCPLHVGSSLLHLAHFINTTVSWMRSEYEAEHNG